MNVLQELLEPVSVGDFLQNNFTQFPFAMPDRAARYTHDFNEADFAAMVESSRAVLRIVRDGRLVQDNARLSWAEAQAYHRRGHTLLVRHAERSSAKLQAFARTFARFLHPPVDIQVYLTPDSSQAFGWHYDLEEVFIIQVRGCKEYTIRKNTLNRWPVWDNMIPSGWWHIAQTQAESIHLSIGVMPVVQLHLFEFLKQRLANAPFWGRRLACVPHEEAGRPARREYARKLWEDMRAQLNSVLAQEQTFQEFMAYLVDPQRSRRIESPADHP
jgi:ribosomal protein L16 Arg81 hydroxylase